jgi:spermidine synthase
VVILSSAALETEAAFGRLALHAPALPSGVKRILIGGLGFAATVRGAQEVTSPKAEIVVVEKLKAVIDLARAEAAPLVGNTLEDPRVIVRHDDVVDAIAKAEPESLSAILLDVDNGPEWASFRSNARLYSDAALSAARRALAPGGIYAVWSGYAADTFLGTLRRAGFAPRLQLLREGPTVRARAYIGRVPE